MVHFREKSYPGAQPSETPPLKSEMIEALSIMMEVSLIGITLRRKCLGLCRQMQKAFRPPSAFISSGSHLRVMSSTTELDHSSSCIIQLAGARFEKGSNTIEETVHLFDPISKYLSCMHSVSEQCAGCWARKEEQQHAPPGNKELRWKEVEQNLCESEFFRTSFRCSSVAMTKRNQTKSNHPKPNQTKPWVRWN